MNPELFSTTVRRLALLLTAGFLFVALGAGYWSVVRAGELSERDIGRAVERARRTDRGRIVARDGTVLVESVANAEGVTERLYHSPLLAPVTGVWAPTIQATGLEQSYNEWLSGRAGPLISTQLDALLHRPIVGADLVTTIDPALQQAADALLGDRAGAIVVLDPRTGDVLALASHPTYNPNTYIEDAEALQASPARPLLNRATQGLYTPGSVFKIVTLSGVLAQGKVQPGEIFEDPGVFIVEGFPVRDNQPPPQTQLDLNHALAYSSNVIFAKLGLRLGADGLREIARAYGFGQVPPVALDAAASSIGSDEFLLDNVGLANSAYGQGQIQVTPLQMALVTAAAANAGVVPEPRLVTEIRRRDGEVLARVKPDAWRRAV
ncbi:MAG TPA: hypothetical protein DEP84_24855, partial [Chloroflexi bacterium]|nr:hypothetical protein [Chloroflexota bacterium]